MTRATANPLRRIVQTMDSEMVAEVRDRTLTLRAKGGRAGGPTEVTVTWGAIYVRCMMAIAEEKRRSRRKGKRR